MLLDFLNKTGVTANPENISPGSIFVDISDGRNKAKIYDAYNNGASLIFTSKNISDPELPVIKVKDTYEALYTLLDKYYDKPFAKMKIIAIGGNNQKEIVVDMLECIFNSKPINEKNTNSINDFEAVYRQMYKLIDKGIEQIPISLDAIMKVLRYIPVLNLDCGILTSADRADNMEDSNMELSSISEIFNRLPKNKPLILNIDEEYLNQLIPKNNGAYLISYGFNNKATVLASSIDITDSISFNFCLQRSLVTNKGNIIEPFEMPIKMKFIGEDNIYNALAAISCALYYDYSINHIKEVLKKYEGMERRFQTIFKSAYTIVDNYCCIPSDFTNTFKAAMLSNHKGLLPIISLCSGLEYTVHNHICKNLIEWSKVLGISEIVFTGCQELSTKVEPASLRILKLYKRRLEESNISFKYFELFRDSLLNVKSKASQNDLILLMGGREMDNCKKAVKNILYLH